MSSSLDAGYYASEAMKIINSKCPKSDDGKHEWDRKGSTPSDWGVCKHCKASYYWK